MSCGTCYDQLQGYKFEEIFPGCRIIDIHEFLLEKGIKLSGAQGGYLSRESRGRPHRSRSRPARTSSRGGSPDATVPARSAPDRARVGAAVGQIVQPLQGAGQVRLDAREGVVRENHAAARIAHDHGLLGRRHAAAHLTQLFLRDPGAEPVPATDSRPEVVGGLQAISAFLEANVPDSAAVRRYAESSVEPGRPDLAEALAASATRALDLFAGAEPVPATDSRPEVVGGLQAISAFLEANVPDSVHRHEGRRAGRPGIGREVEDDDGELARGALGAAPSSSAVRIASRLSGTSTL
ncbi:hypothetical protein [Mycobacterium tuberculosis]|uniref:hypothetical protein n=1 Tax=Mycobacterium tuberculosis TaxID=1773 RepID=UPI00272A87E2|nr:hypothetical protein [Mycobacterium tuberculosis]